MSKLYYTDALASAYMAREFGVKFAPRVIEKTMLLKECHGAHNAGKTKSYKETRKVTVNSIIRDIAKKVERKYYIHTDSYHIFEPQVGDLVQWTLDQGNYDKEEIVKAVQESGQYDLKWIKHLLEDKQFADCKPKIIQRNNKPFFWPMEDKDDD